MKNKTKDKTTSKKLIPKLRFPEFKNSGKWNESKIKNYLVESRIIGNKGNIAKKITVKLWGKGVLKKEETLLGSSNTQYYRRKAGQFIYSKLDFLNQAFGIIPDYLDNYESTIDLPCFDAKNEIDTKFLLEYVQRKDFYKKFGEIADGGRKAKRIHTETFLSFPIYLPPLKQEQQKIADCLSSLDELISLQNKKLDCLKEHKKGLIQQLFPKEGETTPKLRFPEFKNSREWEASPIGNKIDLLSGYTFKSSEISEVSKGIPLMRGINITEGYIRHSQEIDRFFSGNANQLEKFRLRTNDLVIGMDGSKVGKNSALITEDDSGSLLIQRVARLRTKKKETIQFIFQQINSKRFHSYVDRINTSGGIPHISAKQIKDFVVCFPSNVEQQKIADCLSSLDEQITAQSQKIEELKEHKKGLMQQLFPSADEVSR